MWATDWHDKWWCMPSSQQGSAPSALMALLVWWPLSTHDEAVLRRWIGTGVQQPKPLLCAGGVCRRLLWMIDNCVPQHQNGGGHWLH